MSASRVSLVVIAVLALMLLVRLFVRPIMTVTLFKNGKPTKVVCNVYLWSKRTSSTLSHLSVAMIYGSR